MDLFGSARITTVGEWNALLEAATKHEDDIKPLLSLIEEVEKDDAQVRSLLLSVTSEDEQLSRLTALLEAIYQVFWVLTV